jgi:D-beta-D-heptose 7-phosphate kinase/D-beta-D-heptose 1-phosphate adenosyltransferase
VTGATSAKIKSLEDLVPKLNRLKRDGRRIVFTNGCFDLLHVGHVRYLETAKSYGDVLVVAVNSDSSVRKIKGNNRPLMPEDERAELLAALLVVDYVLIFDEPDPHYILSQIVPHILVKGGDWPPDKIIGRDIVEGAGGKVILVPEIPGRSTSAIIQSIQNLQQ